MSISTLIVLLIYPGLYFGQVLSTNALVPSLIRRLNIHHISFLKPDEDNNKHNFVKLQKSLSDSMPWLYISVVSLLRIPSMVEAEVNRRLNSLIILNENEYKFDRLGLIDVIRNVEMSYVKWILITDNFNLETYKDLKIPYNCEFMVALGSDTTGYELIEVYDTLNVKKLRNYLGKWSPDDGLEMTDEKIFKRRVDLQGTVFNISSNQQNPCSVHSFENSAGSVLMCVHFHLFHLLSQRHNFSMNWLPQDVDAYGSTFLPEYLSDEIQFTIFEINLKPEESMSVLWPSAITPVEIYTSYSGRALGWSTYVYPFSVQMWFAVFMWLILSAAVISITQFLLLNPEDRRDKRLCFKMWLKYVFLAFSAFCYQNEGVEPERMSLRILLYLIFLIPTALMPGYSAALTSYLAVKVEKAPFTTIEGLSVSNDYKLGHIASFNLSIFLDIHTEDIMVHKLYRDILLPPDKMPIKESDGLEKMCKEKYSYLCTEYTVIAVPPKCSFYKLDRPLITVMNLMPIKSNNPFKNLINRSFRDLISSAVYFVEVMKILPGAVSNPIKDIDDAQLEAIQFENIVAILVVLGLGILLSVVILFIELAYFRSGPTNLNSMTLPYFG